MPSDNLATAAATLAAHLTTSLLVWDFELDLTEDGQPFAVLFHDLDDEGDAALLVQQTDNGWAIFQAEADSPLISATCLPSLVGRVLCSRRETLHGVLPAQGQQEIRLAG